MRRRPVGGRCAALLATALAGAVLAGCTPSAPDGGPTPTPDDGSDGAPTADVTLPDHDAGRAAAWVLGLLDAEPGSPLPEAEDRLAPAVLDQLPVAELAVVIDQLRAEGPWTVLDVAGHEQALQVRIGAGQELEMQVTVDADGRITGLLFTDPPPPRASATSWAELTAEVEGLTGQTSFLVAEVVDGRCVPLDGLPAGSAAGEQLPIGSIVKLYVLGAVVDAVADGELSWQDEVTVTDDLRSLPSGRLQDAPEGTAVTVLEAAQAMIAISDNTATDLLVDAVGRDGVERALTDLGHADPAANIPVTTTRELFQLGWGGGAELRNRWRDADPAERRVILAELPSGEVEVDPAEIGGVAVWTHDIDWFATADDLCRAHVALAELAATDAGDPVRDILSANPGLPAQDQPDGGDQSSYVAFKGGSSVGTMAGAWYAEDDDGRPAVVVLQSASPTPAGALHPSVLSGIAADALRLAGTGG